MDVPHDQPDKKSYGRKKSVQADINETLEVIVGGLKNPSRSAAAEQFIARREMIFLDG